ncbi:GlxA family transcriptional regulator [Nannocystis bainbridge]|uniref:GlxA family transcriptional regulator n=1 Tax=Nannocystis bainbridge TaxID=2995303 RepID=A0ABT5DTW1_9BACT|nr:GlxA family transcriptional regulator [Nannocystis bainbridge]MDC0716578.1 GlxA family transcriptional regulator [Nannocystis bainbridge]
MPARQRPRRVVILVYPGAQLSAVYGLTDMFTVASRLAAEGADARAPLEVVAWRPEEGRPPTGPLAAVIVPPSLAGSPREGTGPLAAWLAARHGEGTLVCSVCAGTFLLAEAGLLADRVATTHWALAGAFAARFPEVALATDRLLVDDGDVITAGGLMAWTDLGLKLIERLFGPAIMLAIARYFLVDPGGREQRFYSVFAPALGHGDAAIRKVQRLLQAKSGGPIALPAMAACAGLGERTFLRRFVKATGLRPAQYLQHLRVGKARDLLERSDLSIAEVAWKVGYGDPGAFRKIFNRILGLSPGAYRRRFGVAGRG